MNAKRPKNELGLKQRIEIYNYLVQKNAEDRKWSSYGEILTFIAEELTIIATQNNIEAICKAMDLKLQIAQAPRKKLKVTLEQFKSLEATVFDLTNGLLRMTRELEGLRTDIQHLRQGQTKISSEIDSIENHILLKTSGGL